MAFGGLLFILFCSKKSATTTEPRGGFIRKRAKICHNGIWNGIWGLFLCTRWWLITISKKTVPSFFFFSLLPWPFVSMFSHTSCLIFFLSSSLEFIDNKCLVISIQKNNRILRRQRAERQWKRREGNGNKGKTNVQKKEEQQCHLSCHEERIFCLFTIIGF